MRCPLSILSAFVSLALALLAGCHEASAPRATACGEGSAHRASVGVGSTFLLVTVGGRQLPAREAEDPDSLTLLADTIVFTAESDRGSGSVEHHEAVRSPSGNVAHVIYVRDFDSNAGVLASGLPDKILTFHPPPCPPFATCVRFIPEIGCLTPDALTIRYEDPSLRPRAYIRGAS